MQCDSSYVLLQNVDRLEAYPTFIERYCREICFTRVDQHSVNSFFSKLWSVSPQLNELPELLKVEQASKNVG